MSAAIIATHMTKAMLTIAEVAQRLQISVSLVYREIHAGRLRCHRFGRRCYRVAPEDLEVYLRENLAATALRSAPRRPNANRVGVLRHLRI
jgi:excisionase family DNA binding protein